MCLTSPPRGIRASSRACRRRASFASHRSTRSWPLAAIPGPSCASTSAGCCATTTPSCATPPRCAIARSSRGRRADASPVAVAGYHRFLFVARARHQRRHDVSRQGQRAARTGSLPIGYNGRASTVVVSGTPVKPPERADEGARSSTSPCTWPRAASTSSSKWARSSETTRRSAPALTVEQAQ